MHFLQISVGILRDVNDYFEIAFDADKRREFVESAVEFVLTHGLDGLDLFWSYRDLEWVFLQYMLAKYIFRHKITLYWNQYNELFLFFPKFQQNECSQRKFSIASDWACQQFEAA